MRVGWDQCPILSCISINGIVIGSSSSNQSYWSEAMFLVLSVYLMFVNSRAGFYFSMSLQSWALFFFHWHYSHEWTYKKKLGRSTSKKYLTGSKTFPMSNNNIFLKQWKCTVSSFLLFLSMFLPVVLKSSKFQVGASCCVHSLESDFLVHTLH